MLGSSLLSYGPKWQFGAPNHSSKPCFSGWYFAWCPRCLKMNIIKLHTCFSFQPAISFLPEQLITNISKFKMSDIKFCLSGYVVTSIKFLYIISKSHLPWKTFYQGWLPTFCNIIDKSTVIILFCSILMIPAHSHNIAWLNKEMALNILKFL